MLHRAILCMLYAQHMSAYVSLHIIASQEAYLQGDELRRTYLLLVDQACFY